MSEPTPVQGQKSAEKPNAAVLTWEKYDVLTKRILQTVGVMSLIAWGISLVFGPLKIDGPANIPASKFAMIAEYLITLVLLALLTKWVRGLFSSSKQSEISADDIMPERMKSAIGVWANVAYVFPIFTTGIIGLSLTTNRLYFNPAWPNVIISIPWLAIVVWSMLELIMVALMAMLNDHLVEFFTKVFDTVITPEKKHELIRKIKAKQEVADSSPDLVQTNSTGGGA